MVGIPQGEGPLKGEVGWGLDQGMGTVNWTQWGEGYTHREGVVGTNMGGWTATAGRKQWGP